MTTTDPAPTLTSPHPDLARSVPRCPDHGNQLHPAVGGGICKRRTSAGHLVPTHRIAWGPPPDRGGRPAFAPIYKQRLTPAQETRVAAMIESGEAPDKNSAVRLLVDAGLARRSRRAS